MHQTKSSTYSSNAMTVIRTRQKNSEVLRGLKQRVKSVNFVRKKYGQHSVIDEEALVVFCLAAYFRNTPRKMMSQYVFYSEVCAILGDRKRTIHL